MHETSAFAVGPPQRDKFERGPVRWLIATTNNKSSFMHSCFVLLSSCYVVALDLSICVCLFCSVSFVVFWVLVCKDVLNSLVGAASQWQSHIKRHNAVPRLWGTKSSSNWLGWRPGVTAVTDNLMFAVIAWNLWSFWMEFSILRNPRCSEQLMMMWLQQRELAPWSSATFGSIRNKVTKPLVTVQPLGSEQEENQNGRQPTSDGLQAKGNN